MRAFWGARIDFGGGDGPQLPPAPIQGGSGERAIVAPEFGIWAYNWEWDVRSLPERANSGILSGVSGVA